MKFKDLNDNYNQENDYKIKKSKDYGSYWGRLYDMHLIVLDIMINLNNSKEQY